MSLCRLPSLSVFLSSPFLKWVEKPTTKPNFQHYQTKRDVLSSSLSWQGCTADYDMQSQSPEAPLLENGAACCSLVDSNFINIKRVACPNCTNYHNTLPCVPSNIPAKCEVERMNGSRDTHKGQTYKRIYRQTEIPCFRLYIQIPKWQFFLCGTKKLFSWCGDSVQSESVFLFPVFDAIIF